MSIAEKLVTIAENELKVYEAGKQSEYDRFWDAYQQNGERIYYNGAFEGMGWNTETFQPKYNMLVDNANRMFAYSNFNGSLKDRLAVCGVSMSLIGTAANVSSMFEGSGFTEIGELDFRIARNSSTGVFINSSNLVTIEKIILHSNQTTFSNWFSNCTALENIIFEGTINANNFDIHWSTKLTHDSLMSIINCLADRSGQSAYTVTLGTENLAKLTDAEKAIATQKGWTLA